MIFSVMVKNEDEAKSLALTLPGKPYKDEVGNIMGRVIAASYSSVHVRVEVDADLPLLVDPHRDMSIGGSVDANA